jgi:peptidoglycan-associated lipoprotein
MIQFGKIAIAVAVAGLLVACETTNRPTFDPTVDASRQIFGKKAIYFGLSSAALDDNAKKTLRAHADYMDRNSAVLLTIRGSADAAATNAKDLKLANLRADTVRKSLIGLGVDVKRIKVEAGLEIDPKKRGQDAAKSRRVDFIYR